MYPQLATNAPVVITVVYWIPA